MTALLTCFLALCQLPQVEQTFTYLADRDLKSVNLAGTFNGWNKDATPLSAAGRKWTVTIRMQPGRAQYKFVLNHTNWVPDPTNPRKADDNNGGFNSVVIVFPEDYKTPVRKGDGIIASSALYHAQVPAYLTFDRGSLWFTLRVRPGDVERASVVVNNQNHKLATLSTDDFFEIDRCPVNWDQKTPLTYSFLLEDGSKREWFGPKGVTDSANDNQFKIDPTTFKPLQVAEWPEHSVIYQIFPDRFDDGDRTNDPPDVTPWNGTPTYWNRFGGDFAGVEHRLGYLKELGIKAIYFNPIFASPSNHGYETTDYLKVDPHFGTNDQFEKLTRTLKESGIKTVLDGVFNHSAIDFFAFTDVVRNGAASHYKDWYFIKGFPVKPQDNPNYEAWFGFWRLPKLNMTNPDTRKYMLNVARYWDTHAEIGGWRLDVANEVTPDYWPEFRKVVKSDDPNRWIVGEIWGDGSPWLNGDMFDSVMGYQFRALALDFLATKGIGPKAFLEGLMALYASYAPQVSRNLMSLLGSHDTPRFLTLCGNDQDLAKLGATLQLTWVGAPSIYYGDELGMEGGRDPDNRRPMRWDLATSANPMLKHYEALIRARNSSAALQDGDPVPLWADDDTETLAYARVLPSDTAIVAANRSGQRHLLRLNIGDKLPHRESQVYEDALGSGRYRIVDGVLSIALGPKSAVVLTSPAGSGQSSPLTRSGRVAAR